MVPGFDRRSERGVVYYASRALAAIDGVRHGFSTRYGGVSPLPRAALNLSNVEWDSDENVAENRRRFLGALDLDPAHLTTVAQIHSDRVVMIEETSPEGNPRVEGDSLVTRCAGPALGIRVADCFPILAADDSGAVVANAHAGWRGTVARIARKTVEAMAAGGASDPSRTVVAFGPGIRACCFEVGAEVAEAFATAFPGIDLVRPHGSGRAKFLVDLPRALRCQLVEAGVAPANVHDLGACTRCNPGEFFSYRGEGPESGRMMSVIARGF